VIWIIGNAGMLGRELGKAFDERGLAWVGSDRECDIRDAGALTAFAAGRSIDWICNCAAYTAVDRAEDDEKTAREINATGAGTIAAAASRLGARLVHISTDYVFDGTAGEPYAEDAPCTPLGVYGRTKAEGEVLVAGNCRQAFILRTAWLYGRHGSNFVHSMLRLMRERDVVKVVADQTGSPTWTRDLSLAIRSIIETDADSYGTYHFTDEGEITWYEFACAIRDIGRARGIVPEGRNVVPITTAEYPTRAKRPAYSVLSKQKIRATLGIVPPRWDDSLREYLAGEGATWTGR
jgi:dTDP-4-dehydrorhamnose reductase